MKRAFNILANVVLLLCVHIISEKESHRNFVYFRMDNVAAAVCISDANQATPGWKETQSSAGEKKINSFKVDAADLKLLLASEHLTDALLPSLSQLTIHFYWQLDLSLFLIYGDCSIDAPSRRDGEARKKKSNSKKNKNSNLWAMILFTLSGLRGSRSWRRSEYRSESSRDISTALLSSLSRPRLGYISINSPWPYDMQWEMCRRREQHFSWLKLTITQILRTLKLSNVQK